MVQADLLKDKMPLVSIVIPHFNRAALLHLTLASLQGQEIDDWEAIVVDDGSSTEEWACARQFADPRVKFLKRTDGLKGPSRCRNIGTQAAKSEQVMFVDSDDIVAPWALRQRLKLLGDYPDLDFAVFPVMLFEKVPGDQNLLWNKLDGNDDLHRFLTSDPVWQTSSPIWRKTALIQLGGFNERVMYGDDLDLHLRALLHGMRYVKQDAVLPDVFIRRGVESRITNTHSAELIESRRTRLTEGSKAVNLYGNLTHQKTWEGQYFFELEFLLFNCEESRREQKVIIADWVYAHRPSPVRKCIIKAYLAIAGTTKQRVYIILRISRRIAKLLLPGCFFPQTSGFESTLLPKEDFKRLAANLQIAESDLTPPIK